MKFTSTLSLTVASVVALVSGEVHTITFDNRCGFGTPTLISQSGGVLSTGGAYTLGAPIIGALAYLQTGACGTNGDGCTTVETTLKNPTTPGGGSSTDLTLIPPHAFSVTTGFGYYNGCDGAGADCTYSGCPTAFHVDTDTTVQVACQTNDVSLSITFCL